MLMGDQFVTQDQDLLTYGQYPQDHPDVLQYYQQVQDTWQQQCYEQENWDNNHHYSNQVNEGSQQFEDYFPHDGQPNKRLKASSYTHQNEYQYCNNDNAQETVTDHYDSYQITSQQQRLDDSCVVTSDTSQQNNADPSSYYSGSTYYYPSSDYPYSNEPHLEVNNYPEQISNVNQTGAVFFGLPEQVQHFYESKGIRTLYQWQNECLTDERFLSVGDIGYSLIEERVRAFW
jgi:hypothetical protein